MKTGLDHIVIGAADLEQGRKYVKEKLGVEIPMGGKHPRMATHNCLTRLSESVFLEVIAIDPEADMVKRPRWFGLDDPWVQGRLRQSPQLLTWVVNTDDITQALDSTELSFGSPQPLSRDNLRWYFGVPDDGRLLAGGILPYVISWQTDALPAATMADCGLRFRKMTICTPFLEWTSSQLEDIGALQLVDMRYTVGVSVPYFEVELDTPRGVVQLSSKNITP